MLPNIDFAKAFSVSKCHQLLPPLPAFPIILLAYMITSHASHSFAERRENTVSTHTWSCDGGHNKNFTEPDEPHHETCASSSFSVLLFPMASCSTAVNFAGAISFAILFLTSGFNTNSERTAAMPQSVAET